MKKRIALFSIAFLTFIFVANAQSSWGIKAGLNYNTTGKLKSFLNETESIIDNNGKGKSGFQKKQKKHLPITITSILPSIS